MMCNSLFASDQLGAQDTASCELSGVSANIRGAPWLHTAVIGVVLAAVATSTREMELLWEFITQATVPLEFTSMSLGWFPTVAVRRIAPDEASTMRIRDLLFSATSRMAPSGVGSTSQTPMSFGLESEKSSKLHAAT